MFKVCMNNTYLRQVTVYGRKFRLGPESEGLFDVKEFVLYLLFGRKSVNILQIGKKCDQKHII